MVTEIAIVKLPVPVDSFVSEDFSVDDNFLVVDPSIASDVCALSTILSCVDFMSIDDVVFTDTNREWGIFEDVGKRENSVDDGLVVLIDVYTLQLDCTISSLVFVFVVSSKFDDVIETDAVDIFEFKADVEDNDCAVNINIILNINKLRN